LDGNPANNNVENLAWGTAKENAHDRKLHGTQKYGGGMRLAKLTEDEVREIYESGSKGRGRGSGLGLGNEKRVSAKSLAEKYGVSDKTIEAIWYGKSWNHITGLQKKELKWRPAASGLPRGRPRKKLSQPGDSPEQSEPNVT
jgi:hypothetical protein